MKMSWFDREIERLNPLCLEDYGAPLDDACVESGRLVFGESERSGVVTCGGPGALCVCFGSDIAVQVMRVRVIWVSGNQTCIRCGSTSVGGFWEEIPGDVADALRCAA